jgi:hypothetical protein
MNQQMEELVAESRQIVALLRPCNPGLIGFQAVFCCFSRIENKIVRVLPCLPRSGIAVGPNGRSGRVSGKSMDHCQLAI